MMDKKKTLCVGRLLIDVPRQAATRFSGEMIQGFEIVTVAETEQEFSDRVLARESEIAARPIGGKVPGGLVDVSDLHVAGMVGRILLYGRDHSYGFENGRRVESEWVSVEAHAHSGGLSFTLSKTYSSEIDAQAAGELLARLRVRGENEIPTEPGFCIGRALFAEPLPKHDTAQITLHLGLPGHPDTGLFLVSVPGRGPGDALLERIARIDADASMDELMRVTKLRSGKRTINGFDGDEEIERVREINHTTGYSFMREVRGLADDLTRPFLSLSMETGTNPRPGGKPVGSSLHEDAALALWDAISSSIRLREAGTRLTTPEFKRRANFIQPGLQSDNAAYMQAEVMLSLPRIDDRRAPFRHSVLSSEPDSIVKPISTLP